MKNPKKGWKSLILDKIEKWFKLRTFEDDQPRDRSDYKMADGLGFELG